MVIRLIMKVLSCLGPGTLGCVPIQPTFELALIALYTES